MSFSLDYSTSRGQVRLLISDIDEANASFQDDAIDAFIDLALNNNVKRAAAQALLTIAISEVLIQKRIQILDLKTDGPAEAAALRQLAGNLLEQAEQEEAAEDDASFDTAEMVQTPQQWDERIYKERLRG